MGLSCVLVLLFIAAVSTREGNAAGSFVGWRPCSSSTAASIWSTIPTCKPRTAVVSVPIPNQPEVFQVVPQSVLVSRCSGSCQRDNQYHDCIAVQSKMREFELVVQRTNASGQLVSECARIDVEEHVSCDCGCSISPDQCNSNQYFSSDGCRCYCKDNSARARCFESPLKVWDESLCSCRCAQPFRACSTGFVYDGLSRCSCVAEIRPAASLPIVVLIIALVVAVVALALLAVRYRSTRRALAAMQARCVTANGEQMKRLNEGD